MNATDQELEARALASMEAMRSHPEDQYQWGKVGLQRRAAGSIGWDLLSASLGVIFGDF